MRRRGPWRLTCLAVSAMLRLPVGSANQRCHKPRCGFAAGVSCGTRVSGALGGGIGEVAPAASARSVKEGRAAMRMGVSGGLGVELE